MEWLVWYFIAVAFSILWLYVVFGWAAPAEKRYLATARNAAAGVSVPHDWPNLFDRAGLRLASALLRLHFPIWLAMLMPVPLVAVLLMPFVTLYLLLLLSAWNVDHLFGTDCAGRLKGAVRRLRNRMNDDREPMLSAPT